MVKQKLVSGLAAMVVMTGVVFGAAAPAEAHSVKVVVPGVVKVEHKSPGLTNQGWKWGHTTNVDVLTQPGPGHLFELNLNGRFGEHVRVSVF